jgi:predicted nuclease of predicted toxin-antitoxin system
MRLLLDENMPGTVVAELRNRGHDVLSVKESMRGMEDPDILAQAQAESRVVVTQDKDFGELAFWIGLPATCGVILLRLAGDDPDTDNRRIVAVVESRTDWSGAFAVATEKRVRVRPLPSAPSP